MILGNFPIDILTWLFLWYGSAKIRKSRKYRPLYPPLFLSFKILSQSDLCSLYVFKELYRNWQEHTTFWFHEVICLNLLSSLLDAMRLWCSEARGVGIWRGQDGFVPNSLCSFFLVTMVSLCIAGWPQTLTLLLQPPKYWDYRCLLPYSAFPCLFLEEWLRLVAGIVYLISLSHCF
jgi:hypothetical protein